MAGSAGGVPARDGGGRSRGRGRPPRDRGRRDQPSPGPAGRFRGRPARPGRRSRPGDPGRRARRGDGLGTGHGGQGRGAARADARRRGARSRGDDRRPTRAGARGRRRRGRGSGPVQTGQDGRHRPSPTVGSRRCRDGARLPRCPRPDRTLGRRVPGPRAPRLGDPGVGRGPGAARHPLGHPHRPRVQPHVSRSTQPDATARCGGGRARRPVGPGLRPARIGPRPWDRGPVGSWRVAIAAGVLFGAVVAAAFPGLVLVALLAAVAWPVMGWVGRRRAHARRLAVRSEAAPAVLDLLGAALLAGLNPHKALIRVAERAPEALQEDLSLAAAVLRLGGTPASALRAAADRSGPRRAARGGRGPRSRRTLGRATGGGPGRPSRGPPRPCPPERRSRGRPSRRPPRLPPRPLLPSRLRPPHRRPNDRRRPPGPDPVTPPGPFPAQPLPEGVAMPVRYVRRRPAPRRCGGPQPSPAVRPPSTR